ncbi:NAD-dependent protein deacetylase [Nymphon striatum]|nr:NAD-dependent protein deacetylase [Nymphon striatum]
MPEGPKTMADFFDTAKFPGKRGLRKGAKVNLEFALIADGVAAADVYSVLETPEGVDRAFAKLDTIKGDVVWWEAGAQPPQMLADGEVALTTAYNGRIFQRCCWRSLSGFIPAFDLAITHFKPADDPGASAILDFAIACLVTQNVDGLHLRGGAPQEKIIEIHGNATTASCISCGEHHAIELCRTLFEATGESPKCQSCDGLVKANIVMFGEQMPVKKTAEAFKIAETADLFIAIGTSLVVNPAAGLPLHAKHNDAKFAILNRDPT